MKVLQVNNVYKKGSTGKITFDIHKGLLNKGVESIVCYGRGKVVNEKGIYKTCPEWYAKLNNLITRFTGVMYGGCFFSTNKLIRVIKKEKPDIVHIQCINGYFVNIYRLIGWLKKSKIKTVITLHAEFMYTANCGHSLDCEKWKTGCGDCPRAKIETKSIFFDNTSKSWVKMKKAFDGFNDLIVVSVSPWLMNRARQSPILKDKNHLVIFNGLDTNIFHPYNVDYLRNKLGLKGEKIIFHATPSFSLDSGNIKGGYYVAELAKMLKNDNVKIVVAGPYQTNIELPNDMIMLGKITDQELLAKYYSMADVTLLTSKKETFSMVTAESLCCGTPVVGFKAGAPEQIAIKEFSEFVEYGDLNSLYNKMLVKLDTKKKTSRIHKYSANIYDKNIMINSYIDLYKKFVEGE